jgi:hypothetical protein
MYRIEDDSRLQRKFLPYDNCRNTVQFVYHEYDSYDKQTDVPVIEYFEENNVRKIIFVLKFGEDGICCPPVGIAKINNIDTVGNDCDAVYQNENPLCSLLIRRLIPEPERDDLQKQIHGIGICQSRNIELQTAFQQDGYMAECHVGKVTFVDQKEKYPAQTVNDQHQSEIEKRHRCRFCRHAPARRP